MKNNIINSARATMIAIIFVALVVLAILSYQGISLYQKTLDNEARLAEVQQELLKEQERTATIAALQDEINSDTFIERMAKEKLGMIKDNEILFKEKE